MQHTGLAPDPSLSLLCPRQTEPPAQQQAGNTVSLSCQQSLARECLALMMSNSTNIMVPDHCTSVNTAWEELPCALLMASTQVLLCWLQPDILLSAAARRQGGRGADDERLDERDGARPLYERERSAGKPHTRCAGPPGQGPRNRHPVRVQPAQVRAFCKGCWRVRTDWPSLCREGEVVSLMAGCWAAADARGCKTCYMDLPAVQP